MLENLLDKNEKLAILVGAGVSLDAPSNLLDGWSFMFEVLRRVCPQEIDEMISQSSAELRLNHAWKQSWVLSILALPDTPFRRPGEQLRFEVLMAELVQSGVDPTLTVLQCLDDCKRPNRNHYVLAQLIRSGHIVMTTNFDRLIELAYGELAGSDEPPLRVVCLDEEFSNTGFSPAGGPTLWKLHGSLSVNEVDTRHSIQATMMSILATSMTARKRFFLQQVLADFDLLVLGYSGWDDLDIIPTLVNASSKQKLIWVEHQDRVEPVVKNALQLNTEATAQREIDAIGRDRIRFTAKGDGSIIREPEKIFVVSVLTSRMVDAVCKVYLENCSFAVSQDNYKFGRMFPAQVQRYFDEWRAGLSHDKSAPYKFVANIFDNRANARENIAQLISVVREKIDELESAPTASPAERLQHLIARFNHHREDQATATEINDMLQRLVPSLPPDLIGTAARLFACTNWVLYGPDAGTESFKTAVAIDRYAGREKQELQTLTTWRQFNGYNQWSDLFADYEDDEIRQRLDPAYLDNVRHKTGQMMIFSGNSPFPEEETRRIHELAAKIGFFPLLWAQAVRGMYHAIDDDPQVLLILHDRTRRMKRFCVDMGDVLGETQTTVMSGRMYAIDHQYEIAIEELVRAEELHRIVSDTSMEMDTTLNLMFCTEQIGVGYMKKVTPILQRSMWGKPVA